jgi:hypothetical protein
MFSETKKSILTTDKHGKKFDAFKKKLEGSFTLLENQDSSLCSE